MEEQHNIDDFFRQSLGDYREAPPAAAWEKVAARLDADEGRDRRRFFLGWPWISLGLLLLVSGTWLIITLYGRGTQRDHQQQTAAQPHSGQQQIVQASLAHPVTASTPQADDQAVPATTDVANPKESAPKHDDRSSLSAYTTLNTGDISSAPGTRALPSSTDAGPVQAQASEGAVQPNRQPEINLASISPAKARHGNGRASKPAAPSTRLYDPRYRSSEDLTIVKAPLNNTALASVPLSSSAAGLKLKPAQKSAAPDGPRKVEQVTVAASEQAPESSLTALSPAQSAARSEVANQSTSPIRVDRSPEALASMPSGSFKALQHEQVERTAAQARSVPSGALQVAPPALQEELQPRGSEELRVSPVGVILGARPQLLAGVTPELDQPASGLPLPLSPEKPAGLNNAASDEKVADPVEMKSRIPHKPSLSFAALVGYEFGLQSPAPNRVAGAMRLLWHINRQIAIGLQPAFRYGSLASASLGESKAYQRSTTSVTSFTSLDASPSIRGTIDTLHHYVVRERFDSIVVSSGSAGGTLAELELPLIVSYSLGKGWNLYGGPSVTIGGKLSTTAPTLQTYSIDRKDSLVQSLPMPASEFVNYFGSSSLEPYSNYVPARATPGELDALRLGYILGVGYERKRIILGASLHQQLSGYSDLAQPFRKAYSSPYIRLSIGYNLFPRRETRAGAKE